MAKFKPDDIVRSLIHTDAHLLFVMVVEAPRSKAGFFAGVILVNLSREEEIDTAGRLTDTWNEERFELSNWLDILTIAAILTKE